MKTTRTDAAATPIDLDESITLDVEDELRDDSPDETVRELGTVDPRTPAPPKKSKQELIEELSKNYQEVLQLVRKMSDHIDREADREERVVALATKVDEIRDALATMPDRINENANTLNARIVEAIDRQALAEQGALDQMIEQSRVSGEAQGRLVTTMAEFRETMHDMSKSGSRSNEILAEMSRNADATREEIAQLIVTSKRWTTVAMVASLSVAVVAIVIAAISLAAG
ncbi:MAG: hypothetical protein RLN60_00535 [Phycisphaerales bacterium]